MEQVGEILQKIDKIKYLQATSQAGTIGKQKETEYSCQTCESFSDIFALIKSCDKYKHPQKLNCSLLRKKWHEHLIDCGVYERFFSANFRQIEDRKIPAEISNQYQQIKDYVGNLKTNLEQGIGLILKGPVGTMKTTLAVAVLQEALWQGYSGHKILMQSLLDEIFTRKAKNIQEWLKFEKALREAKLLIVDELGKHKSEGWVMTKFEAIVSERHERRRSTIFVTNLTAKELSGLYSEGVIDRFNHISHVINFTGQSLRVKGD